jgi:hypothetical protein
MTTIDNTKPKVQFETKRVLVTPKLAKETLELNIRNRPLTPARVDEFANLMKDGRFQCTHQGIALDDNNNVLDGQHRLAAVVKSNCSVYMLVSKGVPEEARLAVDTGKPRSSIAIAKLIGRTADTNSHYAIARTLKYGPVKSSQMHIPAETLFDLVDTFKDGIDFVIPYGAGINSTILSVVARASYSKDKSRLRRFIDVYRSSRASGEEDTAAIKLKIFMSDKNSIQGGSGSTKTNLKLRVYQLTESAVSDFLNNYPTKTLRLTKSEKFPIPSELDGWN